jgi:hypothetical protein
MPVQDDDFAAGWLTLLRRGFVAGLGALAIATGLCAIPTLLTWFAPGTESSSAGAAMKAAGLLAISGNHGGIVVDGVMVSLTPLLVTLLLGWLIADHARRTDSWVGIAGLATGYCVGVALLAGWARLGTTHAPVLRSAAAGLVFAVIVGGCARLADQPFAWFSERWLRVLRAAGAVVALYLLAGSLLIVGMLVAHFDTAVEIQQELATGTGGLPVALLGFALAPNGVLSAVGYLSGPGFDVGSHASVSMLAVSHGRLPLFPLLAAVPTGRPATTLGVVMAVLVALAAGWIVWRALKPIGHGTDDLLDVLLVCALVGVALGAMSMLAAGGVGDGALRGVGPVGWQVALASSVAVLLASAGWSGLAFLQRALVDNGLFPSRAFVRNMVSSKD